MNESMTTRGAGASQNSSRLLERQANSTSTEAPARDPGQPIKILKSSGSKGSVSADRPVVEAECDAPGADLQAACARTSAVDSILKVTFETAGARLAFTFDLPDTERCEPLFGPLFDVFPRAPTSAGTEE